MHFLTLIWVEELTGIYITGWCDSRFTILNFTSCDIKRRVSRCGRLIGQPRSGGVETRRYGERGGQPTYTEIEWAQPLWGNLWFSYFYMPGWVIAWVEVSPNPN